MLWLPNIVLKNKYILIYLCEQDTINSDLKCFENRFFKQFFIITFHYQKCGASLISVFHTNIKRKQNTVKPQFSSALVLKNFVLDQAVHGKNVSAV